MAGKRDKPEEIVLKLRQVEVLQGQGNLSCCRFRGHEDKIVTKELEIGHGKTEVHEGVQV